MIFEMNEETFMADAQREKHHSASAPRVLPLILH